MNFKDVINTELLILNELKAKFTYNLNKIIYTPDVGILSLSQFLKENYNNFIEPQKRELLRVIIKKSEKLEYLVSNVLNLAKLSSQHFILDTKIINLSEKVQQTIQKYINHLKFEDKKQSFSINIQEGIFADCNMYYLEQAINNILNNAITHGKNNLIEISLCKNVRRITFNVKDRGNGIKDTEIKNIFEMFFTGSGSDEDSSGMGLALSWKIVNLHNGKIWAENNQNAGASFTFNIPS